MRLKYLSGMAKRVAGICAQHLPAAALLPNVCWLCGGNARQHGLCPGCRADLPWLDNACPRCATPLPVSLLCGTCSHRPSPLTQTIAIFHYTYPIDRLIGAAKFSRDMSALDLLGRFMAEYFQAVPDACKPDCIIPVPLHWRRLMWRGYNQSAQLARPVSKACGVNLALTACGRKKNTRAQTRLSAKERLHNIRNAFQIKQINPAWQHVVLIDDVVTTGSTVNELARLLLKNGVKRVDVWACARR